MTNLLTALVACLAVLPATGSQSADFQRLFALYRGQNADRAVRELITWTEDRVEREARLPADTTDSWALAALALLHLESNMARWDFQRYRPLVQLDLGEAALSPVLKRARETGDAALLGFCRDWFIVANTGHRTSTPMMPDWDLETPRRLLGDDAQIQLLLGTREEGYVGPGKTGGPYNYDVEHDWPAVLVNGEWYNRRAAADAEGHLEQALALDPTLVEARLRLGHVHQLMGQPDAQSILERTVAEADAAGEHIVGYLARLFLGQIHEQSGRLSDAENSFAQALVRFPPGLAARLALGQVLFQVGRSGDAWAVNRSVFGPDTQRTIRDPWAGYHTMNFWGLPARLAKMRTQVSLSPWRGVPAGVPLPAVQQPEAIQAAQPRTEPPATGPQFRSGVDGVRVEVLVTDGRRPVTGLGPDDLVLTDSGVRQTITATPSGGLSIALVLDNSLSVKGPYSWGQVTRAGDAVRQAIRPNDHLSVLTANERFTLMADRMHDPDLIRQLLGTIKPNRYAYTAIWDSAFAAAWLVADGTERGLVVFVSDGEDTASWFGRKTAIDRLGRLGVVMDAVQVHLNPDESLHNWEREIGPVGLDPIQSALGGALFDARDSSLASKFEARLAMLRESYVLVYSPNGVPQDGAWHEIKVSLRPGLKGRVQARPGYYAPKK